MNRKLVSALFLILLVCSLIPIQVSSDAGGDWIIDGDKIYVDDDNVYLSLEPHTIYENTDIIVNFTSKKFSGNIDLCFGTNVSTGIKPKNPYIWNGVSWNKLNKDITKHNIQHQGFDNWWVIKNIPIVEDTEYMAKVPIIVEDLRTSGKYFFGIKRSSDPITDGYYIDPWWNSNWNYRQNITIESDYIDQDLYHFPILVVVPRDVGSLCDGGDSIRFRNATNQEQYYEIEGNWSSTGDSFIHVNVTFIDDSTDTVFYMYFNNSDASDDSQPSNVWHTDYVCVQHMNESDSFGNLNHGETFYDSTGYDNDGTIDNSIGAGATSVPGQIGYCVDLDGTDGKVEIPDAAELYFGSTGYTISIWLQNDLPTSNKYFLSKDDELYYEYLASGGFRYSQVHEDDDEDYNTHYYTTGKGFTMWTMATFTFGGGLYPSDMCSFLNATQYFNSTWSTSNGGYDGLNDNALDIQIGGYGGTVWDGRVDEVRISNVNRSEAYITASYHSMNQTDGFLTYDTAFTVGGTNPPSSFDAFGSSVDTIGLSWVLGENSTKTHIRWSTTDYPTSRSEGSLLYNNTGTSTTHTVPDNSLTYYYSAWGLNTSDGNFSAFYSTDSATVLSGNVTINCYEFNTTDALSFDVFITSKDGSETYTQTNCTNPTHVPIALMPQGDDVSIKVSANYTKTTNATGVVNYTRGYYYHPRWYYYDVTLATNIYINAYLVEKNTTELYLISVVGEQGEFTSPPVEGAKVKFRRYINSTGFWQNMSILLTDANGQCDIYLVPGELYKIEITNDNYVTTYSDFIPSDSIFIKTFRILPEGYVEGVQDYFWENIQFNATMISAGYLQPGNISITYADSNSSTLNTQIYTYMFWNGTLTLNHTDTRSGNNGFSYTVSNINTSRTYVIKLFFNNSANFDVDSPILLTLFPVHPIREHSFDFEDRMDRLLGDFELGWFNLFCVVLPLIILVSFGVYNTGLGLIGAGMSIGFMQMIALSWFDNVFNAGLASLCPLVIAIGIIYIWTKGQGGDNL